MSEDNAAEVTETKATEAPNAEAPVGTTETSAVTETVATPEADAPKEDTGESPSNKNPNSLIDTDEAIGDNPDRKFADKFETVDDLEKSYKELQSEFGKLKREKAPEAPEDYEISLSDDISKVLPEGYDVASDPVIESMKPVFKELNLTNEQAAALTEAYIKNELGSAPDPGEELKKLGPNGNDRLSEVKTFVGRNFNEQERSLLSDLATTGEGVMLIEKMAKMARGQGNIPTDVTNAPRKSRDELLSDAKEIKSSPKFSMSPDMKQQYESIMNKIARYDLGGRS